MNKLPHCTCLGMHLLVAFIALGLSKYVSAHTYVWSVWVNGVDQGSGVAIREPAYNGPPPKGYVKLSLDAT